MNLTFFQFYTTLKFILNLIDSKFFFTSRQKQVVILLTEESFSYCIGCVSKEYQMYLNVNTS